MLLSADNSSVLQLKTGEGKSHFVAMRAARHVGLGKKVDVCTAKWSLAERDLLDYKPFFDFLDISTANVHARSDREAYENSKVVYTTPGDLSLFLDEQASQGNAIKIDKKNAVGLGDEFDFLYYEGQKTQFNYARHTGITPKEMNWFYQALNDFYDSKLKDSQDPTFAVNLITDCFQFLTARASEDGLLYLENLTPVELLSWLQSAHEAAVTLQFGINYTSRLEQVKIGEEEFPLREIYPLTTDMQAAVGSTFSYGAHQLLAARLNARAKAENEPQNYHVHPESNIISSQVFSQRLKTLWGHWEGFTGTVSALQAKELNDKYRTSVLHVPTNRKDSRKWNKPLFFLDKSTEKAKEDRLKKIAADIRKRIKEKKSILWCCATDAEVIVTVQAIKKFFTEKEFKEHFLSYTNESHKSPVEILRDKKTMEGESLGQKEKGVILIAAGFGRGDNVEVEAVILTSPKDENDLGQKGGRTARNGEEGEVLQYYIGNEIDEELSKFGDILQKFGLLAYIKDKMRENEHPLQNIFNEGEQLSKYKTHVKFKLLLRLREYIYAKGNYLSLFYHEAKAEISSEGIARIGKAEPQKKDQLIKDFARYLDKLEKTWLQIHTTYKDNPGKCIEELKRFIDTSCKDMNSGPSAIFKDDGEFHVKIDTPSEPEFILEPQTKEQKNDLQTAFQLLITKVNLPEDSDEWDKLIKDANEMSDMQISHLLKKCENEQKIDFPILQKSIATLIQQKGLEEKIAEIHNNNKVAKLSGLQVNQDLLEEVSTHLFSVGPEASDLCEKYILDFPYNKENCIKKMLPMLSYSAQNSDLSISFWSNTVTRDSLLTLPASCFTEKVCLEASNLLAIKNLLDPVFNSNEIEYAELFNQFIRGMENQPESRKRLLDQYESILKHSKIPKRDLLKKLAKISENFQANKHFSILRSFIEKINNKYKEKVLEPEEIDKIWEIPSLLDSNVVDFLPLLQNMIDIEGKKFVYKLVAIFQLVSHLTPENQKCLKESEVVQFAFVDDLPMLNSDNIQIFSKLLNRNKEYAVDILLSSLSKLGSLDDTQIEMINLFYNNHEWIASNFINCRPSQRLAIMHLLKNEYFVSRAPTSFEESKTKNDKLYQTGLDSYHKHIFETLASGHENQTRGFSAIQKKKVLNIMVELEKISKDIEQPAADDNIDKAELKIKVDKQIESYEKLWFKDGQRFKELKQQVENLDMNQNYEQLVNSIRQIKKSLIEKDTQKTTQQFFPRLHFCGQSRLYKTVNDIEDLILKDWALKTQNNINISKNFTKNYNDTKQEYIDSFRKALKQWDGSNVFSLFRNPYVEQVQKDINSLKDEEIIGYLIDNSKSIKNLPGALVTIANEIIEHSVDYEVLKNDCFGKKISEIFY